MSRGRAAGSSRTNTLCLGDGFFRPAAPCRHGCHGPGVTRAARSGKASCPGREAAQHARTPGTRPLPPLPVPPPHGVTSTRERPRDSEAAVGRRRVGSDRRAPGWGLPPCSQPSRGGPASTMPAWTPGKGHGLGEPMGPAGQDRAGAGGLAVGRGPPGTPGHRVMAPGTWHRAGWVRGVGSTQPPARCWVQRVRGAQRPAPPLRTPPRTTCFSSSSAAGKPAPVPPSRGWEPGAPLLAGSGRRGELGGVPQGRSPHSRPPAITHRVLGQPDPPCVTVLPSGAGGRDPAMGGDQGSPPSRPTSRGVSGRAVCHQPCAGCTSVAVPCREPAVTGLGGGRRLTSTRGQPGRRRRERHVPPGAPADVTRVSP